MRTRIRIIVQQAFSEALEGTVLGIKIIVVAIAYPYILGINAVNAVVEALMGQIDTPSK